MKTFSEICKIVETEIAALDWGKQPAGLYEPIAYTLALGGKRIRPALVLMACEMFKNDVSDAVKAALGVEIFHNFTLLHDDIMDKAEIRRSQPTVWKRWNENTAILSGDQMLIEAYCYISQTPQNVLPQVLDVFTQTAAEVCEGQQYDMEFEMRENVSAEEYIEMIRLKTSVLLAAALKIGAIIGGADEKLANLLYDFGISIGLAFQLKDDLLDVYGNEATFGKKIGGDILCNKKTYLLINALNQSAECMNGISSAHEKLQFYLSNDFSGKENEKIAAVTAIYNELKVKEICEEVMNFYYQQALAALEKLAIADNKKSELKLLAEKMLIRND